MKGVRKYSCQLSRKIVERAQMKRKGVNMYHKPLIFGKGWIKCGKLGNNGVNCGKKGECSISQCCFGKATLQNYEKFRKSSVPAKVMYFWNGVWNEFSPQASNSLREAFSSGMPTVEVVIDGSPYLVDFLRMLQVDLRAGCQRSIAWIDKNGSCFYPTFVLEDNFDEEEVSRKLEVEIEIRISPSEASNTKRCGVVADKRPQISEVSKTKKDCHPGNFEASKTHPTEASNIKRCGVVAQKRPEISEMPKTKKDCHSSSFEASKSHKLGLAMNLDKTCNVPTPKPLTKVACMNDPKAYQMIGNSPTKLLAGANESEKRTPISCDDVGNGTPHCLSRSESKQCSNSVVAPVFEHLSDKLVRLKESDEDFASVRSKFLDGLRKIQLATTITGIYRNSHASVLGQARLQAFIKQIEITRNSRGTANVRYAWHGTSDICVSTIIMHGFSETRVGNNGPAYGVGVYLAPEDCSYLSVPFSSVDKNDEQHMVLCRVILGNVEQVPLGSRQFHPSFEKYDSGVDDLTTPKYHIVWSTHMNTHILPEYVISFKAPHPLHGCSDGLKANPVCFDISKSLSNQYAQATDQQSVYEPVLRKESGGIASLANMSFLKLLSIIRKHLPTASINSLEQLYTDYKVGRIGKDIFIRRVRMIAGDNLLLSVIRALRGQRPDTPKNSQQDIGGSERVNLKNEFTTFPNQKDPVQIGKAEPAAHAFLGLKRQNTEDQFVVLMGQSVLDLQSSSKHESAIDRQSIHCKDELF